MGQKYVFIPGIPQPTIPGAENQTMSSKQVITSVPVSQVQHGGQLQYQDLNFSNTGVSGKPVVGFPTSFSHVTAAPDISHVSQHDQNYSPYSSQNYSNIWNARSTSPLLRGSSMSTCFLPPTSNNLFCRGSSFHNLRNDGSQSPVFVVLQSVGSFNNPQPCILNPIYCTTNTSSVGVNTSCCSNNFNDHEININKPLSVPSLQSHSNNFLNVSSVNSVAQGESVSGSHGKYVKYITPVGSRSASPIQVFPNKIESESPLSTPPPQIISSPPALATHILHPESRIGYPVIFSPKTSPPPTPLRIRSRSATPVPNLSVDYASSNYLNTLPQSSTFHSGVSNANSMSQAVNSQFQSYRSRSNTFGGVGGTSSASNHLTSQAVNPRQRLSPLPLSVMNQLNVPSSNNDPYRNSYTIIPFDRSCRHSPIHLSDNGPFVASPSSSRLFMSLAVENSRKLNSPSEGSTVGPTFRRNFSVPDDYQCMQGNAPMQYNTTVYRQQKISADNCLCRQGSSHPASAVAPDSSHERLSPIGLRAVSSCYNAVNTSQVDPVKVSDVNH